MQISLQHMFRGICFDKSELFHKMINDDGTFISNKCTVSTYMNSVCKQANGSQNFLAENQFRWEPSKYVGDGFEIFVECLIKLLGLHPDIGISEYVPQPGKDNGVDGAGKGILDSRTITVQAKYRPREDELLTAGKDRLDSFWAESTGTRFRVKLEWDETDKLIGQKPMLVITTGKNIHQYTKVEKYDRVMRCIGSVWLGKNIDGNVAFWKQFRDLMI